MAKKSVKDRIREAQAKTRAAMKRGGAALGNMKPVGVAAAAGAVGDIAAEAVGDRVDLVGKNWYGEPALMLLGALLVRKKSQTAALGLAGAAGAKAAFNYRLSKFQRGERATSPVRSFAAAGGGAPQLQQGGTSALIDSDMIYGDTSALQDANVAA